jgi:hypothetical protein
LAGIRVLVIRVLDPSVRIGNVPVKQVLPVVRIGFQIGLLYLVPDELSVPRGQLSLDEIQVFFLGIVRELLSPDCLLEHIHQVHWVRRDLLGVEVEGARQNFEGEAGRDPVHPLVDACGVPIFLNGFRAWIGIFEALAVIDAHL